MPLKQLEMSPGGVTQTRICCLAALLACNNASGFLSTSCCKPDMPRLVHMSTAVVCKNVNIVSWWLGGFSLLRWQSQRDATKPDTLGP